MPAPSSAGAALSAGAPHPSPSPNTSAALAAKASPSCPACLSPTLVGDLAAAGLIDVDPAPAAPPELWFNVTQIGGQPHLAPAHEEPARCYLVRTGFEAILLGSLASAPVRVIATGHVAPDRAPWWLDLARGKEVTAFFSAPEGACAGAARRHLGLEDYYSKPPGPLAPADRSRYFLHRPPVALSPAGTLHGLVALMRAGAALGRDKLPQPPAGRCSRCSWAKLCEA